MICLRSGHLLSVDVVWVHFKFSSFPDESIHVMSVRLSVHPSTWNNPASTGQTFKKFDI